MNSKLRTVSVGKICQRQKYASENGWYLTEHQSSNKTNHLYSTSQMFQDQTPVIGPALRNATKSERSGVRIWNREVQTVRLAQ